MNKDLHSIDDLFKNSINLHTEEVPADAWKNIDQSLDKKRASFYKKKYFVARAAAIILLLIGAAAIAAILYFHTPEKALPNSLSDDSVAVKSIPVKSTNRNSFHSAQQDEAVNDGNNEVRSYLNTDIKKANRKNSTTSRGDLAEGTTYTAKKGTNPAVASSNQPQKEQMLSLKAPIKSAADLSNRFQNDGEGIAVVSNQKIAKNENPESTETNYHETVQLVSSQKLNIGAVSSGMNVLSVSSSSMYASLSSSNIRTKHYKPFASWSIMSTYSQNASLNRLKDDDRYRDARNNREEAKRTEQETKSFTAGIGVAKQLGRNFLLQTGLSYFASQTFIEPKTIFALQDNSGEVRYRFPCSSGSSYLSVKSGVQPTIGDSIHTHLSKTKLSYLQVPLLASYQMNAGRFSFSPSAGISANFLLNGTLHSSLDHSNGDEEVLSSIDGLRPMFFSGVFQAQLNYNMNSCISFVFDPNINFSISPVNKETAVKTYMNLLGFGAGLRIKL